MLALCAAIALAQPAYAQTVKAQKDSLYSPLAADSVQAERLWILGASWGNNSSFLGRNQSERLPFYSTDLSYISKKGFWLSAIAYQVVNTTSFVDEVDLTAGWAFTLSSRLDAALYYSKFFFSPESTLLKSTTGNALSGHLGLDWNLVYSRLTTTATFGGSTDFFLILDNSRSFGTGKLLHKADSLVIEPKFSILAGTQHFVETHMTSSPAPDVSPIGLPGRPAGPGGGGTTQTETTTSSFSVLNYEVSLPITYSINNLSLEVVPRYAIPVNQLEGSVQEPQLFVTASLYYIFRSRK